MNNKQEAKKIIESVRASSQKNGGEFLCIINLIKEEKMDITKIILSACDGNVPDLIENFRKGSQSKQTMGEEASKNFKTLRAFSQKNDREFLCIIRYPIGGKPELFFDHQGDSEVLLKQFEQLP